MAGSNFRHVSMGIVLKDKPVDSWEIEAKPHETNGLTDGTIDTTKLTQEVSGVNAAGEAYSETVKAAHGVRAKWYCDQPNRLSAPDVKAGETVELWKYGDSDEFYWKASNMQSNFRDKETITVAAANKPKKDKMKLDASNSYFMEMCTRTKQITLKTNKNDGEKHAYTIQVNTKDSAVIIEDDIGNLIQLDSETNTITFISASKSSIVIDKNITMTTDGKIIGNAKGGVEFTTPANITMTASGNYSVKAATYLVNSANLQATAGSTTFKTKFEVTGKLTNNGVNVGSTHSHIGNLGRPVSPPQ